MPGSARSSDEIDDRADHRSGFGIAEPPHAGGKVARLDVENQEAAMILDRVPRRGLAQPGAEVDLGHLGLDERRTSSRPPPGAARSGVRHAGCAGAHLLRFERFDVFNAIDDAAADLEKAGTLPDPPPTLQRAMADIPALATSACVDVRLASRRSSRSIERESEDAKRSVTRRGDRKGTAGDQHRKIAGRRGIVGGQRGMETEWPGAKRADTDHDPQRCDTRSR